MDVPRPIRQPMLDRYDRYGKNFKGESMENFHDRGRGHFVFHPDDLDQVDFRLKLKPK